MPIIQTDYALGLADVITIVMWRDGNQCCSANLNPDGTTYTYKSYLTGDKDGVVAPNPMSLADCALAAYVHLGLIPPQKFPHIACENQH